MQNISVESIVMNINEDMNIINEMIQHLINVNINEEDQISFFMGLQHLFSEFDLELIDNNDSYSIDCCDCEQDSDECDSDCPINDDWNLENISLKFYCISCFPNTENETNHQLTLDDINLKCSTTINALINIGNSLKNDYIVPNFVCSNCQSKLNNKLDEYAMKHDYIRLVECLDNCNELPPQFRGIICNFRDLPDSIIENRYFLREKQFYHITDPDNEDHVYYKDSDGNVMRIDDNITIELKVKTVIITEETRTIRYNRDLILSQINHNTFLDDSYRKDTISTEEIKEITDFEYKLH